MKQTTLRMSNIGVTHLEDKTTLNPPVNFRRVEGERFSSFGEKRCPVCGVPRINPIYCLNCATIFDKHLLRLEAARVASLEDEA